MYTDPRVIDLVEQSFVPVRVHVKDNASDFKRLGDRFGAQWTPTILIVDREGQERHRIEGFLPADDFLSQLILGSAHAAFAAGDFARAERLFEQVMNSFPSTDAAPEAQDLGRGVALQGHRRRCGAQGDRAQIHRAVSGHQLGEEGIGLAGLVRRAGLSRGCTARSLRRSIASRWTDISRSRIAAFRASSTRHSSPAGLRRRGIGSLRLNM